MFQLNILKRALITLNRNKGKSILLVTIIMIISTLVSSSIVVNHALENTDKALRMKLPAVATIHLDGESFSEGQMALFNQTGEWMYPEMVSLEIIRKIGGLPYVRMFDANVTSHSFYSSRLERFFDQAVFDDVYEGVFFVEDHQSYRKLWGVDFERFIVKGVENPNVVDIESGLIDLIMGRTFTEAEVLNGEHVVLVSQPFLATNGLNLGDVLVLEYRVFGPMFGEVNMIAYLSDENLYKKEVFEFEIVGVFDRGLDDIYYLLDADVHIEILNTIYMPNKVIAQTYDILIEAWYEEHRELLSYGLIYGNRMDVINYDGIIYLLYDPLDLQNFRVAAQEKLPDFWVVSDLSNAYYIFENSMSMMHNTFQMLFIASLGAMLITVSLLIFLYLRDRRQEIGIYLALGEKKGKILKQILIENIILGILGITLGLWIGYAVSGVVSRDMLQTNLMQQAEGEVFMSFVGQEPEGMGFRHRMTNEEMMEVYDTSISISIVMYFYVVAIGTIVVATILPTFLIIKIKPKNTLLITLGS